MTISEFIQYCEDNNLLNKFGKLYSGKRKMATKEQQTALLKAHEILEELTSFLPTDTDFVYRFKVLEAINASVETQEAIFCPVCGSLRSIGDKKFKFNLTCDKKDTEHQAYIKKKTYEKQAETRKKHPEKFKWTKEQRQKFEETCKLKYGASSPLGSKEIRRKSIKTLKEKYGVKNPMQVEDIKKKAQETNLRKYNALNPMKSKEIQAKAKLTNFRKYGGPSPTSGKKIRQKQIRTLKEKYGVDNPMKNKELVRKSVENRPLTEQQKRLRTLSPEEIRNKFIAEDGTLKVDDFQEYLGYSTPVRPYEIIKELGIPYKTKAGGFDPNKRGVLYYIKDTKTGLYKIGITNFDTRKRFKHYYKRLQEVHYWEYEKGRQVLEAEKYILQAYKPYSTVNIEWSRDIGGHTEFFTGDVLGLDTQNHEEG